MTADELHCPLKVIRKTYDETADIFGVAVESCGAPLHVETRETYYVGADGWNDCVGPWWQVECESGHVVFVPDHEADDNYHRIPFDDFAHAALLDILALGETP